MHRIHVSLLAGALALAPTASPGQEQAPSYDPRAAHAEADRNGDGQVDREEFHQRMVEIFFHGDRDKDGYMTFEELRATVVFPEDFSGADRDGDDRISLYEFMAVRFYTFDEVDSDRDGRLSQQEVVDAMKGKSAR